MLPSSFICLLILLLLPALGQFQVSLVMLQDAPLVFLFAQGFPHACRQHEQGQLAEGGFLAVFWFPSVQGQGNLAQV